MLFCYFYNVVSENYKVQYFPGGGGAGAGMGGGEGRRLWPAQGRYAL